MIHRCSYRTSRHAQLRVHVKPIIIGHRSEDANESFFEAGTSHSNNNSMMHCNLVIARRHSFKYARHVQLKEMRQPEYIYDKIHGVFSRGKLALRLNTICHKWQPIATPHMSLWSTDTDASTNRFFRGYYFGTRELHLLLGRSHGVETNANDNRLNDSAYELSNDMRYKGIPRPAITNVHYESEWQYTLYRCNSYGNHLTDPRSPLTEEILGPKLLAIRDIKNKEHCMAWFDRLKYLIDLHYEAVGDIGEFKSRHTQHVHEFFVHFHDALTHFDFQDTYLLNSFKECIPVGLEDLFAIFLEMEGNYVHEDYCPRCSLPYATTRFCGEGDVQTPFRKHRGRWAPHQQWGTEWYNVVTRRAEQLWYRATEDPYFGTPHHTQRQVEALLRVYVKAHERGKAIDFMHRIRGSMEFLMGHVQITDSMQSEVDALLDSTPHQHMLTNQFKLDSRAAMYTGDAHKVPHSPLQMRLDLELNKFRRMQREEGVVKIPPASWQIDTSFIVPYKLNSQRQITNWREVKDGIEQSFLRTGLPQEAYTSNEWREMLALHEHISHYATRRAQLEEERKLDEAKMLECLQDNNIITPNSGNKITSSSKNYIVFPDKSWYRVFDTNPETLKNKFGVGPSGTVFVATAPAFANLSAIEYLDNISGNKFIFNITPEMCKKFGEYESGDVLRICIHPEQRTQGTANTVTTTESENLENNKGKRVDETDNKSNTVGETDKKVTEDGEAVEVVVIGVSVALTESEWALYAMYKDPLLHAERGLVELGKDCVAIAHTYGPIVNLTDLTGPAPLTILEAQRTIREEFLGQVIGIRHGVLYVQWRLLPGSGGINSSNNNYSMKENKNVNNNNINSKANAASSSLDRSVAMPLGTSPIVRANFTFNEMGIEPLTEPASWHTPFRNDLSEERLKELEQAPFKREKWASLIANKFTPKTKRFGYYQHTTQDDFQTKEYKDRLLARQYYNNPEAFTVIPERKEKSVNFYGKWEYMRTHGLPSVDRNELENGWGAAPIISDAEMQTIEQALRDISGHRPGNFYKTPQETSKLQLNESWWTSMQVGWEEHNKAQRALCDPSEQDLIDQTKLPFRGTLPPFGTSYGIAERIRNIVQDYSKGFGLGPNGHSALHDTSEHNILHSENDRVKRLGLSHVLVRLFDEKLGSGDVHSWALQQCAPHHAHVKKLLLSLHEWREKGQKPSLLLCHVLSRYLRDEIEMFNYGIPAHVPKLTLPTTFAMLGEPNNITSSTSSTNNNNLLTELGNADVWYDVDKNAYAYEYAEHRKRIQADEPFIVQLVQRANMNGLAMVNNDQDYIRFTQESILNQFHMELAKLVGQDIPTSFMSQKTAQMVRGNLRMNGNVATLLRASLLAQLLSRLHVTEENVNVVIRGLANCAEQEPLSDGDFVVPVSLVLSWDGSSMTRTNSNNNSSNHSNKANSNKNSNNNNNNNNNTVISQLFHGEMSGRGGNEMTRVGQDKMIVHVLEELALLNDGLVMDIRYAIRENKLNKLLRQEFFSAFLPVFNHDFKQVGKVYEDYCEGKYVPNITVAIEAFIAFLANIAHQQQQILVGEEKVNNNNINEGKNEPMKSSNFVLLNSKIPYFELNGTGRHPGQYTQLKLLPPECGPHQFENTLVENIETVNTFHKFGILAGPTRVMGTGFISANCKSLNYFTQRREEVVYVTTDNDQGLLETLRKSAHYKIISSHVPLRFLLNSPHGAGVIASFNRFFYRVTPMLHFYQNIIHMYNNSVRSLWQEAENANRGLARVLESEMSNSIEQNFRRNSERYWRSILEGRSVEESAVISATSNLQTSSSTMSKSSSSINPIQQQQQPQAVRRVQGQENVKRETREVNRNINNNNITSNNVRSTFSQQMPQQQQQTSRRSTSPTSSSSSSSSSKSMNDLLSLLKKGSPTSSSQTNSNNNNNKNTKNINNINNGNNKGGSPNPRNFPSGFNRGRRETQRK